MGFVLYQPGLWSLQNLYTRCFLVVGESKALLLDSGIGNLDVRALAEEVTTLPIVHVNSHAHCDHIGRSLDFSSDAWAHPAEFLSLQKALGKKMRYQSAQDGHVFELGGHRLRTMHLPGHTPGSIALIEEKGSYFLSVDQISSEFVFLTGAYNIADYRASLQRLLAEPLLDKNTNIYPAHGAARVNRTLIDEELELVESILSGFPPSEQKSIPRDVRVDGQPVTKVPRIVNVYRKGTLSIFIDV